MEGLPEQSSKEHIRDTIMKQDKIFKEQVQELHRLYRVQKILMSDQSNTELQLNCTSAHMQDLKNKYLSTMSTLDTSHSSYTRLKSQKNSQHRNNKLDDWDEDCEVELSLSIGHSSSKEKPKSMILPPWLLQATNSNKT